MTGDDAGEGSGGSAAPGSGDDVSRVLAAAFPDRSVARVETARGSASHLNRTLTVEFEDASRAYLKLRSDGDAERNAREAAVTRYADAHCPPVVPTVLAADSGYDPPYLAVGPVEAESLADRWSAGGWSDRENLARAVGATVADVATPRLDGPGWIRGGGPDGLDLETGSWSEVLADAVERRATETGVAPRFSAAPGRVAGLLRERSDVLDGAPAALVHADLRRENLLLAGSSPAVIDWEWTLAGDPGLALCWAVEWVVEQADVPEDRRPPLARATREGYRGVAGRLPPEFQRRRPVYRVVTFLDKVRSFDRWAPATDEPTADLAEWVRDELEGRFAAARAVD